MFVKDTYITQKSFWKDVKKPLNNNNSINFNINNILKQ